MLLLEKAFIDHLCQRSANVEQKLSKKISIFLDTITSPKFVTIK